MKKSRKLITIISLCLVIAALCSMAAFAAETRTILFECPSCGSDAVYRTRTVKEGEDRELCTHHANGYDYYPVYRDYESLTCTVCSYSSSVAISDYYIGSTYRCEGYDH